jgi:hypothetical protein
MDSDNGIMVERGRTRICVKWKNSRGLRVWPAGEQVRGIVQVRVEPRNRAARVQDPEVRSSTSRYPERDIFILDDNVSRRRRFWGGAAALIAE